MEHTTTPPAHSPTPWTADWRFVRDQRRNIVLEPSALVKDEVARANAAFTVRACNAHEELLAACKTALSKLELIRVENKVNVESQQDALKAAIAHAEGR